VLEDKIKNTRQLKEIIKVLKKRGKKIVFTNGCFDILHYGHVKYLQEAKKSGDVLIVGLNSDTSVRKIKGKNRPLVRQFDRLRIIAALESVDYVTTFSEPTPQVLIQLLKPDVLIKGSDYKPYAIVGADFVKGYGGRVVTVRYVRGRSSSSLIEKIIASLARR
jgi:D-beta-D-heptose 7-phosphate kinase/D-beta-D-heptose 1-phosphate adenosyltransferase